MLVLLPPSEGKAAAPRRGGHLDLARLSFPELTGTRERVLDSLTTLCADPERARAVLGLPPGLASEITKNARLLGTPTLPAGAVYTGVLYDALNLAGMDPASRRRSSRSTVVMSGLWGALRLGDRIPPYRLSMDVSLPGIGPLAACWRQPLADVLPRAAGRGLVVDLRSATYAAAWRPAPSLAARTVAVRVLRESGGERTVVSHLAKHTRGQVARALMVSGVDPRTPAALAEVLRETWPVELVSATRVGAPHRLDVVLTD